MSLIKSQADIENLREGGKILGRILGLARKHVQIGMKTKDIDSYIADLIKKEGVRPSFLNFEGFPACSCLSVNSQVVHGIPGEYILKDGDILGIDVGLWHNKTCVDAAITIPIGSISPDAQKLISLTEQALTAGIKIIKPYRRVGSISHAISTIADQNSLGIVRALTGHGVGHQVHESPEVPNYGKIGDGMILRPGMVLAIEPMFTLGSGEVLTEIDGWGIVTADDSFSSHFEHTVVITAKGAEVLTKVLA